MKYQIALKRPEEKTTWDLFQVFFATVKCGSYKKAADYLLISPRAVCMALHDLESRLSQKIINNLPKNTMEMERYSSPLMTSEGTKWYLVVSELTNKENIEERLSYFKRESMMPFGFEPIAYNMWQLSQGKGLKSLDDESTFCLIKLLFKEEGKMKKFKILTTDSFAHYIMDPILAKLIFKYPDIKFSIVDATIDREPEVDLYFLHYEHLFRDFLSDPLVKSKLCLYANGNYIDKKGVPKTMDDLLHHSIIRPQRSNVLLKFGVEKWKTASIFDPIYHKKDALEVDTLTSLIKLGDEGAGIICSNEKIEKWHPHLKMEKLPDLCDDVYVTYTMGFHEKHRDNALVEDFRGGLKSALLA